MAWILMTVGLISMTIAAGVLLFFAMSWREAGRRERETRAGVESELADRERAIEGYMDQIQTLEREAAVTVQRESEWERRLADQKTNFENREAEQKTNFENREAEQKTSFEKREAEQKTSFEKRETELEARLKAAAVEAQKQAEDRFKSLAGDVLEQANGQFLELAKKKLEVEQKDAAGQLEQRKQAIEAMLKPINETLSKHEKAVGEIEKNREGAYHALRQQLGTMTQASDALYREAGELKAVLKGSTSGRGDWGEFTLKRLAELSGMVAYCDFDEQVTIWKGDRQQRPDMVVNLPAGRSVIVDSKAVGAAYFESVSVTDPEQETFLMAEHVRQIESRVNELSGKRYADSVESAADFVVLFLPADGLIEAAVREQPNLLERAMNRGVVIATPSMLFALLKSIAVGWRERKVADNAAEISKLGKDLHERVASLVENISKLGGSLGSAVKHYNRTVGGLESRVLVTARKFQELGADSPKELPAPGEIKTVEAMPREVGGEVGGGVGGEA